MDIVGVQVMRNQRNEPLLVAGNANNDAENPQVVLKFPIGVSSVSLRCLLSPSISCSDVRNPKP